MQSNSEQKRTPEALRLSDLLDGLPAPDLALEETKAVSPERIKEIAMQTIHNQTNPKRRFSLKRPAALVLAAALALALGVSAFAAASGGFAELPSPGVFFRNVFGDGVEGQAAQTVVLSDGSDGGIAKTEHYPAVERVAVDEEQAEALTGAYINPVGQYVVLGDYTFTLERVLADENGIGALTLHVENPNGHGLLQDGWYTAEHLPPFSLLLLRSGGDIFMDTMEYYAAEGFTQTQADCALYFTPVEPLGAEEALTLEIILNDPETPWPDRPRAELPVPLEQRLPLRHLEAEGLRAEVSPVGMTLYYDAGEAGAEQINDVIELRFADGSVYTVKGEDLVNISVGSVYRDWSICWYAFNRLADTPQLTEARLVWHSSRDGVRETTERVLLPADTTE